MSRAGQVAAAETGVRLDTWLWAARLLKTRSLAKAAIAAGRVSVGGQAAKPARVVRVGDRLRIVRAGETFECVVENVSGARGPARVARALWRETEASTVARAAPDRDARGFRRRMTAMTTLPGVR